MRVLSGIQPTGRFHWGNYFGAIQQYIELQNENEAYYFIANLHALTTIRNREQLAQNTLDAAIYWRWVWIRNARHCSFSPTFPKSVN